MAAPTPLAGSPTTRPATTAQSWRDWQGPLLLALATVVALRLLLSGWAALILAYMPTVDLQALYAHVGFLPQPTGWIAPWEREDALWYEKIATVGYAPNDGTTGYFPLLPLVIRVMSVLTLGNVPLAGILVGSLSSVAALALLYRLVATETDPATAGRTVAYLALFPTAFFLYSAFTESLFLALTLGAFWCARQGKWPLVALLAFLTGLTKVQGAFIGLPLAAEYLARANWQPAVVRQRAAEFAAVVLAGGLGTLVFFAYLRFVVQDPLTWTTRQMLMLQHRATWPGETLWVAVQTVLQERSLSINWFDLAVLLLFTGLTLAAFRLRLSYGLQAATILLPSWFHVNVKFPVMSVSRFVLVAFPCFLVLAIWAGRKPRIVHLVIIALWISWLLVWTSQAVRGFWVG
jgi:hypothetical protein